VSGKYRFPDAAYRFSTLLVLKAPVQRCTAEFWIGSVTDKILVDAEAQIRIYS
jgi:hypothetical protein